MAIEFACPHCTQLLRVGDETAGKTAKCPMCNGLAKIPGGAASSASDVAGPSFGGLRQGGSESTPNPFGPLAGASNPFADGGSPNPAGLTKPVVFDANANPYASPATAYQAPTESVPVVPQAVGVEPILNYAWDLWKEHLGLLVGVTITIAVITNAITLALAIPQWVLAQNGEHEAARMIWIASIIVSNVMQVFLAIGEKQIVLKLARRQPAKYSDLFGGAPLFLPVLGASILFLLALLLGSFLLLVPAIIAALMWWSSLSLIVDGKTGVLESFSLAAKISQDNWGTTLLLWLLSIGIIVLGCLAACIGVLFAIPLVSMLWSVAYLMMAGQIPIYGQYVPPASATLPDAKWQGSDKT